MNNQNQKPFFPTQDEWDAFYSYKARISDKKRLAECGLSYLMSSGRGIQIKDKGEDHGR